MTVCSQLTFSRPQHRQQLCAGFVPWQNDIAEGTPTVGQRAACLAGPAQQNDEFGRCNMGKLYYRHANAQQHVNLVGERFDKRMNEWRQFLAHTNNRTELNPLAVQRRHTLLREPVHATYMFSQTICRYGQQREPACQRHPLVRHVRSGQKARDQQEPLQHHVPQRHLTVNDRAPVPRGYLRPISLAGRCQVIEHWRKEHIPLPNNQNRSDNNPSGARAKPG